MIITKEQFIEAVNSAKLVIDEADGGVCQIRGEGDNLTLERIDSGYISFALNECTFEQHEPGYMTVSYPTVDDKGAPHQIETIDLELLVVKGTPDFSKHTVGELDTCYKALQKEVYARLAGLEPWMDVEDENGDCSDMTCVLANENGYPCLVSVLGKDKHGIFHSPDGTADLEEGCTHVGDLISLLESREGE